MKKDEFMLSLHYPSEIYNPAKIDNKLKEYYSVPSPDLLLVKLHFIDQRNQCAEHCIPLIHLKKWPIFPNVNGII